MAAPKFTKAQREQNLLIVSDRYLKGIPQAIIARELGVSPALVNRQLKQLYVRWQEQATANIDQRKSVELARIDKLEAEAWAAWERSCKTSKRTVTRKTTAGASAEIGLEKDRDGDPRFLEMVLKCIDRRCKIIGIDAPQEISIHNDSRPFRQLSDAELSSIANLGRLPAPDESGGAGANTGGGGDGPAGVSPAAAD